MNKNTALATLVVGTLALTGCSGDSDGGKVRGKRDDLRLIPAVSEKSHQEAKTKTKCVSRNKNEGDKVKFRYLTTGCSQ